MEVFGFYGVVILLLYNFHLQHVLFTLTNGGGFGGHFEVIMICFLGKVIKFIMTRRLSSSACLPACMTPLDG